eukprot:TRINITY_DN929_c0_g2_i1.p1 TRINITY_DN929_c0_g2~~TRINITY_DN929_c0_g2_i1.p1  ORF type:complete len:593 (+),score=228.00 TRINITY_DN929_c0_g2_i1:125-1903(+)
MYGSGEISPPPADIPCGQFSMAGVSQQLQQLAMQQQMMGGAQGGSPILSPSMGSSMHPFSLSPGGNFPPSPGATSPHSHGGFNRHDYMRGLSSGHMSPMSPSRVPLPMSPHSYGSPSGRSAQMGSVLQHVNGQQVLVIRLEQYVPPQTNPQETREENNFRHALPPRMLHKHKRWIEQHLGPSAELMLNIPAGLVELSRKRLSRGDARYKGLSEMNLEARVVGEFDPVYVQRVFDDLFINNKRTVRSSRRRCFEVINSVKSLTETTGAFVISRPVDECIDIYGPQEAVDAAQAYLTSMQSQSGVSKRVIQVKSAAASVVIRQRRSILSRDEGSLFVEPPPRGRPVEEQTVTIYAYSDVGFLDRAEQAIRDIEREVMQRKGAGSPPVPNPQSVYHLDPSLMRSMSPPMDGQMPVDAMLQQLNAIAATQQQHIQEQLLQMQMQMQHPPQPQQPLPPPQLDEDEELLGVCAMRDAMKPEERHAEREVPSPSQSPPPLLDEVHDASTDGQQSRGPSRRSSVVNLAQQRVVLATPHANAHLTNPAAMGVGRAAEGQHYLKGSVGSESSQALSSPQSTVAHAQHEEEHTPPRSPAQVEA